MLFWGFVCVNQRDLREIYWGFFCADCLSTLACYSPADSADHAERNAAGCIISQRKTGWWWLLLFLLFLGFVCVICEICGRLLGFHLSNIDWVLLREYSPADYADHAEECSKLHYFAEKDSFVWGKGCFVVLGFCLRKSARSAGDFWGFICANRLSTLACLFSRR